MFCFLVRGEKNFIEKKEIIKKSFTEEKYFRKIKKVVDILLEAALIRATTTKKRLILKKYSVSKLWIIIIISFIRS